MQSMFAGVSITQARGTVFSLGLVQTKWNSIKFHNCMPIILSLSGSVPLARKLQCNYATFMLSNYLSLWKPPLKFTVILALEQFTFGV